MVYVIVLGKMPAFTPPIAIVIVWGIVIAVIAFPPIVISHSDYTVI